MYLPVFLWTVDCEKRGVSPFWELLEILSTSDGEKLLNLETNEEVETGTELVSCLYCGKEWKEKGLKKHMKHCKDGPHKK